MINGAQISSPSLPDREGEGFGVAFGPRAPLPPLSTVSKPGVGLVAGLSCVKSNACLVVGSDGAIEAEYWDGAKWTNVSPASHSNTMKDGFLSVSCSGVAACLAVGAAAQIACCVVEPLAESWNGSAWTTESVPNPPGSNAAFWDVSCASAAACMALGTYIAPGSNPQSLPFSEWWNGTTWTIVTLATSSFPEGDTFDSVSCPSITMCMAVGSYNSPAFAGTVPLVEQWQAARGWSIIPSAPIPNPFPPSVAQLDDFLGGVSCPNVSSCIAVGGYGASSASGGTGAFAMAEYWNGNQWTMQLMATPMQLASPPSEGSGYQQSPVSCVSATACTAVWPDLTSGAPSWTFAPLAGSWDGSAWNIRSTELPGSAPIGDNSFLTAVSCITATDCFVGGRDIANLYSTLLEQ